MDQANDDSAVEFGAMKNESSAMEDLVDGDSADISEDVREATGEKINDAFDVANTSEVRSIFNATAPKSVTNDEYASPPEKIRTNPMPSPAKKRGFNAAAVQNGLIDDDNEGGIAVAASAGANAFDENEDTIGRYVPEKEKADLTGWYELSGFTVQYEPIKGAGTVSAEIRNYFEDLESAMISINDHKYMMPVNNSIRIGRVSIGAPTISFEERSMYEYIDGKWRRV